MHAPRADRGRGGRPPGADCRRRSRLPRRAESVAVSLWLDRRQQRRRTVRRHDQQGAEELRDAGVRARPQGVHLRGARQSRGARAQALAAARAGQRVRAQGEVPVDPRAVARRRRLPARVTVHDLDPDAERGRGARRPAARHAPPRTGLHRHAVHEEHRLQRRHASQQQADTGRRSVGLVLGRPATRLLRTRRETTSAEISFRHVPRYGLRVWRRANRTNHQSRITTCVGCCKRNISRSERFMTTHITPFICFWWKMLYISCIYYNSSMTHSFCCVSFYCVSFYFLLSSVK